MKIELQYFEGCPHFIPTRELIVSALKKTGIKADLQEIEVPDLEKAQKVGFLGSPTVRINGKDIEEARRNHEPCYSCRTYTFNGRTQGTPPEELIIQALKEEE